MLARIQFRSEKFRTAARANSKRVSKYPGRSKSSKPRYERLYRWLSAEFDKVGVRHKLIDLDRDKTGKKTQMQYGYTILVMLDTRYQLVCGWFPIVYPKDDHEVRGDRGIAGERVWGIEIYKERGAMDRWLGRKKLNEKDALVTKIMGFLSGNEFSDVKFISEKSLKNPLS